MIAQKLKNNCIAIGQNGTLRDDAIEVIYELRVGEFYKLVKATNNWGDRFADRRDIMFTQYTDNNARVVKEFDAIYARRKLFYQRAVETQSSTEDEKKEPVLVERAESKKKVQRKQTDVSYPSNMIGTSKLLRIPTKQIIKIVKRKGKSDCINKPNVVCISNECRERFFKDVKKTEHYKNTKLFEMMYSNDDQTMYERWDAHIDKIYNAGLEGINGNT